MNIATALLPFANEVGNVLTESKLKPFARLYKEHPYTSFEMASKMMFDTTALVGIILNASKTASEHGFMHGFIKGVMIVILAFIIPNFFFHTIFEKVCGRCNPYGRLVLGFFMIGALSAIEYVVDEFIIKNLLPHKENSHHE